MAQKIKKPKNSVIMLATMGALGSVLTACGPEVAVEITGTAQEDSTLQVVVTGDGVNNISYQWQRAGVDIAGATNDTYTLVQADVGAEISLVAAYTDDGGNAQTASYTESTLIANVNDAGSATITGTLEQNATLTANVTDEDGLAGVAISYQWQRDGVDIAGANEGTYTLEQADVGAEISLNAAYTDGQGTAETASFTENTLITNVNDAGSVTITGTAKQSETLTAIVADEDGVAGVAITYQWQRDGVDIGGETAATYILVADDVGAEIKVTVVYTDELGSAESLASDASAIVTIGASMNLANLVSAEGFRIDGEDGLDLSGRSVSGVGDVNGDGYDDVIIGAWGADPHGASSGASYVVFGKSDGIANVELSALNGNDGFVIEGVAFGDQSGYFVSGAGDVNGDGYDDVIIGALFADPNGSSSGSSYVVFGKADGFAANMNLSTLDGSDGFRLDGGASNDNSGVSVSSAGDVNGDGYDDIIVGAYLADPLEVSDNLFTSGSSYVIFGKANGFAADMDLSALNVSDGFRLDGVGADYRSGVSVSSAGDVNGDGYDDLIIGSYFADSNGMVKNGSSYVVFGKADGFGDFNLSILNGSDGFKIDGVAQNDNSGFAVSAAGDMNGDGYDDVIIGAHQADLNGNSSGSSYVVFGGAQFAASAQAATIGDDVLTGTENAETLNGGDGDDSLTGLAGDDILKGGNGQDALHAGVGVDKIWGGGGNDTFTFNAGDSVLAIVGSDDDGTIAGYDTIYDFKTGDGTHVSETFDTVGTAIVAADGDVNGANIGLTIDGATIKSHSITDGVITFDDDDAFANALEISTEGEIAAVATYLQLQDLGDAGTTVAFDVGADTFIFTQGDDLGVNDSDILVRLEDVQVDALVTAGGMAAFDLLIA